MTSSAKQNVQRSALDIPVEQTTAFVTDQLPSSGHLLEVGCGDGRVAASLGDSGFTVTAIDGDADAIDEARRRGVSAECARWPAYEGIGFDAVLFVRSLHHLEPLEQALAKAVDVLAPGGLLIVDDFAFSECDLPTAEWLRCVLGLLDGCSRIDRSASGFVEELLSAESAHDAWHHHHGESHDLHSASAMRAEIGRQFNLLTEENAAYLYRYVCRSLAANDGNQALARQVLDLEQRAIACGAISPIGRRWVARART